MIDMKLIRERPEWVQFCADQKGYKIDVEKIIDADDRLKIEKQKKELSNRIRRLDSEIYLLDKQIGEYEAVLGPIVEELKVEHEN